MFKIVNAKDTDHHIHSSNFSDGLNTIEEIVEYAGALNLKEITITDHSQAGLEGMVSSTNRPNLCGFRNVKNNVIVNFSVEADLLDERGNVCSHIQNVESEKFILSCHPDVYNGDFKKINDAYEKAIEKYKDRIICIGHPCLNVTYGDYKTSTSEYLDIERLTEFSNKKRIPLELNGADLVKSKDDATKLKTMLERAKYIMVNSDAHCLYEMKCNVNFAYGWLREKGFL